MLSDFITRTSESVIDKLLYILFQSRYKTPDKQQKTLSRKYGLCYLGHKNRLLPSDLNF